MKIEKGDYFKTRIGFYYEATRVGHHLINGRRLYKTGEDKKSTVQISVEAVGKIVESVYKTENEKRIIRNRIEEETLKKEGIDIEDYTKADEMKRREILNKTNITFVDKVNLLKYKPIKIDKDELQKKLNVSTKCMNNAFERLILNHMKLIEHLNDFKIAVGVKKDGTYKIEKIKEHLKKFKMNIPETEFYDNMPGIELANVLGKNNYTVQLI